MIYLDHNATTPVLPEAIEAMLPWLDQHYANPSSQHRAGRLARHAIDEARAEVAALVGATPESVIFTSGGTEANNLALNAVDGALLVGATEHSAVLEPARRHQRAGRTMDIIPVDDAGIVDPARLQSLLDQHQPALVSLMWANNESGVVQDIAGLGALVKSAGARFHSDAVQAAGKLAVDFASTPVDLLSLSAHKIYGPKGVGALIRRRDVPLQPVQVGGNHESGLRAGTENLPGIVGFGVAARRAREELAQRAAHVRALREQLEAGLSTIPAVRIVAANVQRVPNTCQLTVAGFHSEALLMELDRREIAVTSGSACKAGSGRPTHVLLAMGYSDDQAHSAIRISFGRQNTSADVEAILRALRELTTAAASGLFGGVA